MNPILCSAIASGTRIEFFYDGRYRAVDPYCHGISTAGHEVLRAYQYGGSSSSGPIPGWRLFDVRKMSALRLAGEPIGQMRLDYVRTDSAFAWTHCRLP